MAKARGKLSGKALADFNAKHPRGSGGKFGTGGGAAAALNLPTPAPAVPHVNAPSVHPKSRAAQRLAAATPASSGTTTAVPVTGRARSALKTPTPQAKPVAQPSPGKPVVTTRPSTAWPAGTGTAVDINGANVGAVVLDPKTGIWMPFGNRVHAKGQFKTEQEAIDALVAAATPRKVTGPGLSGLNLTEVSVPPQSGTFGNAKFSHEIQSSGTPIGTVHYWGYGYTAETPSGQLISGPNGHTFRTKSQAAQALAAQHGITPAAKTQKAPAPPPVLTVSTDPEINAALDILYGKDAKGHTIARQLEVYGGLRRSQYDQLGPAEKSTVLGDLSFIASTSKGPNATKASKLVDRFTPPGTPHGQVPKQAIHIPPNVAVNQSHVTDPAGTLGLLSVKPKSQRGKSGDGWTSTSSGGRGPWGQYGAAGLMLRHVDANGEERFLMVERGPGISDPGMWQFPGGAKEEKETFHEGAAREVVEELGFQESDLDTARVHGTHTKEVPSVTVPSLQGGKVPWAYVSIAATVDRQLMPDLSTPHAQQETSDAKWMTRAEIDKLDTKGKLLKPLAGGQLQQNILTLFPSAPAQGVTARTNPLKRPSRLRGTPTISAPKAVTHKPSTGRNLVSDTASRDKLRQDVKQARSKYSGKVADDRLAAIGAMQGFDDVPTVVTKSEFDRLLASGDYIEAWRGVRGAGGGVNQWRPGRGGAVTNSKTAHDVNEEFRSGPAYYGNGIFGNGYYFATDKSVAAGYADSSKGSLLRVLIPKKANIVAHSAIRSEAQASGSQRSKAKGNSHETATLWDEGRFAAAKGHDAIEIKSNMSSSHVASSGKPAFNILNRSVLIVEEAP